MSEKAVNKAIAEIYETIERSLPRKNSQVARAVGRARLMVADVLAKYTNQDGVIPRNKVSAVVQELQRVEAEIYKYLRDELRLVLADTAEYTVITLAEALVAIYGAQKLLDAVALNEVATELGVELAEVIYNLLTDSSYKKHRDSVVESAFSRRGDDGLALNARLKNISLQTVDELLKTLRQTIGQGEGTSDMIRQTERVFKDIQWRLDTVTETETLFTARQALAKFAEESGVVRALKIVDYPHGNPKEHMRHKCYKYAHANEHDLGKGVYPVHTRKIRNPHPRCRSTLHFVMVDELI